MEIIDGIESPSLVIIGGRPGMGITTLGLSWNNFSRKGSKGHFLSLYTRLNVLENEYRETPGVSKSYVEQPTTLQLMEHIIKINESENPDYFVIDSLDYIGHKKPMFLNENKKYQKQLRHLRVLAQAMKKSIFLLATLDQRIEEYAPFLYHRIAHWEKHVDSIFILYRWEYYQESLIVEDGSVLEENEALLIVGKSPNDTKLNYLVLIYDPVNRSFSVRP